MASLVRLLIRLRIVVVPCVVFAAACQERTRAYVLVAIDGRTLPTEDSIAMHDYRFPVTRHLAGQLAFVGRDSVVVTSRTRDLASEEIPCRALRAARAGTPDTVAFDRSRPIQPEDTARTGCEELHTRETHRVLAVRRRGDSVVVYLGATGVSTSTDSIPGHLARDTLVLSGVGLFDMLRPAQYTLVRAP